MSTSIPAQHHGPGDTGQAAGFTRVPPQDLDAEAAVLGSLILSGDRTSVSYRYFAEILDTGLSAEDCYKPVHTVVHRAVCALHGKGEQVDPITLAAELARGGDLARVGGPGWQPGPTPPSLKQPETSASTNPPW